MATKISKTSVRVRPDERDQLWVAVLGMLGEPRVDAQTDDFWDPERDVHFRPARFLTQPAASRRAVETLVGAYKDLVAQEEVIDRASPSLIRAKVEKVRNDLLKAATSLENLSQAELRVVAEAAPQSVEALVREITPLSWPGQDSRSAFSDSLRQKAEALDTILESIRSRPPNTAWKGKADGRGRSILHHLGIAPAPWQLIHMTWRLFEDFGRAPPAKAALAEMGAYIHQLATGEQDIDLDSQVGRYVGLRPEFDALTRQLRLMTPNYSLENFFQLHDYVRRRMESSRPPAQIQSLHRMVERYLALRTQLTAGPKPVPRKPRKNS